MLHHVIYVVLVLLHQLADCKPVENTEETLENLYKIIKNETCSLDISSSVDDNKFIELCGDKSLPKLKDISDDRFLFNFQDYLCYSVYHNVKALCDPGHKQSSFTPQPFESEPGKFCSSIPDVNITEQCNTWLEGGAGDMGTEDCNLVSKVIATIMKNSTLCSNECIKADKLDPMCQSLVGTSLILAEVNNVSVKNSSEDTLPPSPREIIEKRTEQSESTKKSEEAEVEKSDSETPKVPDNKTVTKAKEEKQEAVAGKPEAQALKDDNQDKGKNEKITSAKEEKKEVIQEKNEKISSVAEGNEKEEEEVEEDDYEEEDEDNQDKNGDEKKSSKTEKEEEEDEAGDEIEPETTDLTSGEVTKTTEEKKEEPSPTAPPRKDKTEEVNKDFQGSIKAGNDIEDESHFFSYFMMLSVVAIVAYLVFHNKRQVSL